MQVQVDEETGQGPSGAAVDLHHQLRSLPEYARHRLDGILAQHVTACEQPVAAVLFGGASNSQAAHALGKTVGAVRGLRKSLFKRLGVRDRGELVLDLACKLWRDLVTRVGPFLSDVPLNTDQASQETRTVKSDDQLTEDQWRAVKPLVARPRRAARLVGDVEAEQRGQTAAREGRGGVLRRAGAGSAGNFFHVEILAPAWRWYS